MTTTTIRCSTNRSPQHHPRAAAHVRAGDTDRNRVADLLGQAFAQGYLDLTEYDDRLQKTWDTTSHAALTDLLKDLPVKHITRHDPRRHAALHAAARRGVRLHLAAYLAAVGACLTIWLAVALTVDAWYFWPVWPILGGGIGVLAHAIPVHAYLQRHTPTTTHL